MVKKNPKINVCKWFFIRGFAVLVGQNFSRVLFLCACVFVEFDFPSKISGDVAAVIQ